VDRDVRVDPGRSTDVAVGFVATAFRFGAGAARVAALPGRVFVRSFFVAPLLRGAGDALASSGKRAQGEARRRTEAAAAELLAAPETARTVDRALAGPVPAALSDETIDRIARRLLESAAFEQLVRDAADSKVAHDLVEDALQSPELQRAVEEVLAGPAVRNALGRETRTLWDDVTVRLREATGRLDDRLERAAHRALRRSLPDVAVGAGRRYAGLASRAAGFTVDAALTHVTVLVVGALVGIVGWLLGVSAPGWLVASLAGAGWAVFVGSYFVFFWATAGQTPGMRVVGVRVVDTSGRVVNARRGLVRLIGAVFALVPFGAGFVPVVLDSRRRALPDYLARTVVVRTEHQFAVSEQAMPSARR
jgi:uncharacterized RDD family membrane protein YckC